MTAVIPAAGPPCEDEPAFHFPARRPHGDHGFDPGIAASDTALETGSIDPLVKLLSSEVDRGLRQRFAAAAEARTHAAESVEKGRLYVEAYVAFMHYAERLLANASSSAAHAEPAAHAH